MKNLLKVFSTQIRWICAIALVAIIGFSFFACDENIKEEEKKDDDKRFDTTALAAVISEAGIARDGIVTASSASEVPTGRKWVTQNEWNAFDTVYKTAVETKTNPSNQSAVDTAKTNLQTALVAFNAAKKNGSAAAIKLNGTMTVKNNGQIVPYILLQAHTDNWSWQETIRIPLTAANTPWEIITKPFTSSTEIGFIIFGYDNDQYENYLFQTTATERTTVYNTDKNNIAINLDYNFITLNGTFNLDYGKVIPSVRIEVYKKSDGVNRIGVADIFNAGNNTPWSMMIPSQSIDTDTTFSIIAFDGPIIYEYDQLFALWQKDFSVRIRNQNKTGIALNFINISGTVNVAYNGNRVPTVEIVIFERLGGDLQWVTNTKLYNPSANAPWSTVIPAYTGDTDISIAVEGKDGNDNSLFWTWVADKTVKNTNVSGIAANLISLSGTINVTYNGNPAPFVEIHINGKVGENWEWLGGQTLNNPSANTPWFVFISAFTSDTEIHIDVGVGDDEDDLKWGTRATKTVKNSSISNIALNLGNITN